MENYTEQIEELKSQTQFQTKTVEELKNLINTIDKEMSELRTEKCKVEKSLLDVTNKFETLYTLNSSIKLELNKRITDVSSELISSSELNTITRSVKNHKDIDDNDIKNLIKFINKTKNIYNDWNLVDITFGSLHEGGLLARCQFKDKHDNLITVSEWLYC